jgi:4-aminobutyrate aminotransferase/(S)-3-amino-2-methylpropionate transaminase
MQRLAAVETRNVTWRDPAGEAAWPVAWTEAEGANVRDADGNVYLDLTAAFGVCLAGHRPPGVVEAIRAQADRLVHGMGDVHPPDAKVELLEALTEVIAPVFGGARATLATSGSEAVEIALKTAQLATADEDHPSGRSGIIAFEGGYHGLTLGALAPTHRREFREPFAGRTWAGVAWAPYPGTEEDPDGSRALALVEAWLAEGIPAQGLPDGVVGGSERVPVGAVIVEPVQARGGVRVLGGERCPDVGRALSDLVADSLALLVADEIFTGFGRCGAMLGSARVGLCPDVLAVGKVLGGGMPLSACVGTERVMDAWPPSPGEAIHTSTFLGHPLACAAGAAMLRTEVAQDLPGRAEATGERLRRALAPVLAGRATAGSLRGLGLLLGFDVLNSEGRPEPGGAVDLAERLVRRGVLVLPAGPAGATLELTPPVTLTDAQIAFAVEAIGAALDEARR